MQKKQFSFVFDDKVLIAEFTDLAERANGSVLLRCGDTVILATAVMAKEARENGDFLPLTVEYEEKFYASGQIPGNRFTRREGKPSDEALLAARIIDRTLRPLFDQWIRNEIQIVINILSLGGNDPDILAVIASSLAVSVSDIPFNGPVSAVRIGKKGSDFEMVACGKDSKILMLEMSGNETGEKAVLDALKKASEEIEKIQEFQKKVIAEMGKAKRRIEQQEIPQEVRTLFQEKFSSRLEDALFTGTDDTKKLDALEVEWMKLVSEKAGTIKAFATRLFEEETAKLMKRKITENDRRIDGRGLDEIRPIFIQAGGISPILHGSGIFYRGATHLFSVLTLGGPKDAEMEEVTDGSVGIVQRTKRFFHQYNFPPFSVGETGRIGTVNRRMIGHGALAEKALMPMIPPQDRFPYTIRIVSETLSSNGSTSMASVCASSIALMDGGVPIKRPVAGISCGLIGGKILTDIQGPEDHYGDMDFKVAGTQQGITAIQMDVKIDGIGIEILEQALEKAKNARLRILDAMREVIPSPRAHISPNAPKIIVFRIDPREIGLIIGASGKTVTAIQQRTGTSEITIENDGKVLIVGKNGSVEKAHLAIQKILSE